MIFYNNFYLVFQNLCGTYYSLFFSILSLGCIAISPNSETCRLYMGEVVDIIIEKYFKESINNKDINVEILKSNFIDFVELIFYQSQILSDNLDDIYNNISLFVTKFNNDKFNKFFENELVHYKINQNLTKDFLNLSLEIENITFRDINLLMISHFSIITNNIDNFKQPIYILNKTGIEIFNNVYAIEKLTSYQENIYLLILDHKILTANFVFALNNIVDSIYGAKKTIKNLIMFVIFFNFFIFIMIIIILLFYLFIYYIITLKSLAQIHNSLKEKIEDITIKEILRSKIDNLNLLLDFYKNDINKIVENLNNLYNNFKENIKQKIKEESKLLKKEGIFEKEKRNEKINYIKIFKTIKKLELIKYSGRKTLYSFTLKFIIILYFIICFITLIMWISYFQKEEKVNEWNVICENTNGSTNNLMNNYLTMIYNNETLEEMSIEIGVYDFISFIYSKITPLYELDKYASYIWDLLKVNENTMIYECSMFYENLDNPTFKKLKSKFKEKENKLIYTMRFFCEWSNLMIFNNFKTIYMQLFNIVKTGMESFNNYYYDDIIEYIDDNNVVQNEIMFMIIYVYMMDVMNENVHSIILKMDDIALNYILTTMELFFIVLFIIVFIIYYVYIRNINYDCKKFMRIKKIFRVCKVNE